MLPTTRRLLAAGVVDLVALISLSPDVFGLLSRLSRVWHLFASDPDASILQIGGAALWCVALWLGVGLLATAACQRDGERRIARAVSRYVLPAVVRRALAGAVGVGVVLSPAVALATPANASTAVADSTPTRLSPVPLWPVESAHGTTSVDTPLWPVLTSAPVPATSARAISVTVQPGDSLWSIAQKQLGSRATPARTTAMWHQWFHANRQVIGDDPSLIHPGQVLHAPEEIA